MVLGILVIVVSLALFLSFPPKSWLEKLLYGFPLEIGFAFVIAWVVANLVESKARQEYDRYTQEKARLISQNVFGYLYSVNFPRSAFSVLEDFVFSPAIIKTYQKLDYELITPEVEPGWVKMRCEFDYSLKNVSEKTVEHDLRFHFSKIAGLNEPEVEGLGLQSLVIGDQSIPSEQFDALDHAAEDEIGRQRFLVVRSIPANSELRVRVTFVQLKRVDDNDLYQSGSVCENLELKLRYDPTYFDVFIEPIHPSNSFDSDIEPCGGDNCRIVRIDQALLPKNGVFMWWNKK